MVGLVALNIRDDIGANDELLLLAQPELDVSCKHNSHNLFPLLVIEERGARRKPSDSGLDLAGDHI
jgi:hypothetical protein